MTIGGRTTLLILVLISFRIGLSASDSRDWSWTSPRYAACPGIGIAGTFTVHAEAVFSAAKSGSKHLKSLAVYAESPAFTTGKSSIAARVAVLKDNQTLQTVSLGDASPPAVIKPPTATQSKSKFLAQGKELSIPAGAKVEIEVTATVSSSGGASCALGTTKHQFDPQ